MTNLKLSLIASTLLIFAGMLSHYFNLFSNRTIMDVFFFVSFIINFNAVIALHKNEKNK